MSAVETTVARMSLPIPAHFSLAEQSFSLKKRRRPLSTSPSSFSSPAWHSHSLPPPPPSKGCASFSRFFPQQPSSWTPLSHSLCKSPPLSSVYNPSKQQSYFSQCFVNLGLLGRGSFGEVYKVQSHEDGRLYAVKRSAHRFRGKNERSRSVREARNHERLSSHPHILKFVAAWEEGGRLYIQTELCSTNLLQHAENQPPGPDESAAWDYLCDLLSALEHLHSHGFVHLDLKPDNVLITPSGRLKLGDFGLLCEFNQNSAHPAGDKVKEEAREGDPRYMAPELLHGEYGPAADVFSLGVSILELACNIEVPNGGEGWQQLRQGNLPPEVTNGLSVELQTVLRMMLAHEPSQRPAISELCSLPAVRKRRWKRRICLLLTEAALTLTSICQGAVHFGRRLLSSLYLPFLRHRTNPVPCTPPKDSWDRDLTLPLNIMQTELGSPGDEAVFLVDPVLPELTPSFSHRIKSRLPMESTSTPRPGSPASRQSPTHTPKRSLSEDFLSFSLAPTPSSIHTNGSCHRLTPNASPRNMESHTNSMNETSTWHPHSPLSMKRSGRRRNWVKDEAFPQSNLEPKNLLNLFEKSAFEGQA